MRQTYKSVYFPDTTVNKNGLTLAFSSTDQQVFDDVKPLSSHEMRQLLGFHLRAELIAAAQAAELSVNTFCIRRLRKKTKVLDNDRDIGLFQQCNKIQPLVIDPISSTYRGGKREQFHSWFPYLEAYSSAFVLRVLDEFANSSQRVLDPFGGLGTTPLAAVLHGREAAYCEVNPLLQFVTQAKVAALSLNQSRRRRVVQELVGFADTLGSLVQCHEPNITLRACYVDCFGTSCYFDPKPFEQVLRTRSWLDSLEKRKAVSTCFATVAAISSLIPSSRLIRRGDLRFKNTFEALKPTPEFVSTMAAQLRAIAADISGATKCDRLPMFLAGDARELAAIDGQRLDALVTSPPYLNGTNYFRNTKVELWFLRAIKTKGDLAKFRRSAVTAGINDVVVGKLARPNSPSVQALIAAIAAKAYDRRIPQMVAAYINDMREVFAACHKHLESGSPVMVDIGDSVYAGVHVPTHTLLIEVLSSVGYLFQRSLVLRKRASRSGSALTQTLLVFRVETLTPKEPKKWTSFKAGLPHQSGEFAKRNWGHPLHSLCSYQGKMKPSIAHHLIDAFVPKGGRMLDPFGGVGTIPFEAALAGATSFLFDISPSALCISQAKLGKPDRKVVNAVLSKLEDYLRDHIESVSLDATKGIRFNGPLTEFFHPDTLCEILCAREFFISHKPSDPSSALVCSSLLHILHGNRPYALSRNSHPITPFAPTGSNEYRGLLERLRKKVERSLGTPLPLTFKVGTVFEQDMTAEWPQEVCELDAIITSPPFFDSTRFYLANWMRLWFCGWNALDFVQRPKEFVDERQKTSFRVYTPLFEQARERLKHNGVIVMHLGKSKKCDMIEPLALLASKTFKIIDRFNETVGHCESHGIRDKGAVVEHSYLVLGR